MDPNGWPKKLINTRLFKDFAYLVATSALIVAAHFFVRNAYCGEWLPNTYCAKHVRPWDESGFCYLVIDTIETGLYLLLPLVCVAVRSRWQLHRGGIYDDGIALLARSFGHGPKQLHSEQLLELGPGRSSWYVLRWRTEPDLNIDIVTSLRFYSSDGEGVFQQDTVLSNTNYLPTSYWSANSPVETMILLHLPPDLPPGDYELRMVVYDFETQLPTVQIDVWEPETTLARLRLAERR